MMTPGCDFAGVIRPIGATAAAPSMPIFKASESLGGVGGNVAWKRRGDAVRVVLGTRAK